MLRSAIFLAALMSSITIAQAQTTQADQSFAQTRNSSEASSTTTGQSKETPFPDMMKTWEYSAQEWQ
jgi:hypothetical protein